MCSSDEQPKMHVTHVFLWIVVVCVAIVVLCGSWLVWVNIQGRRAEATNRDIAKFQVILQMYSASIGRIPGPTLSDAVAAVRGEPLMRDRLRECPMVVDGKDAWNNAIEYLWLENNEKIVAIRSCGKNGRDDGGGGDDIQYIVSENWMKK